MVRFGGRRGMVALALVVVIVLAAVGTVGTSDATARQVSDQPEADNSITRIAMYANGSATWTLTVRTRLETDEDQAAFERFQDSFRENRTQYVAPFRDNIRSVVGNAAGDVDREMSAERFSAETDVQPVPRRWGVVRYEFSWTNFAATEDERLVVGDVFDAGFFIAENDSLRVLAPDGYRFEAVDPAPDTAEDRSVVWSGRRDFANDRPRVVLTPDRSPATTDTRSTQTQSDAATGGTGRLLGGLLALTVVAGAGGLLWRRRTTGEEPGPGASGTRSDRSTVDGSDDGVTPVTGRLQDDETQVLAVLEAHDGEMKQSELVESVDWSKSKVSRVLSEMAADGTVEKFQLGRENLVRTTDDQPQND